MRACSLFGPSPSSCDFIQPDEVRRNYRSMLLTGGEVPDVDLNKELDLMEALIKVHLKGYQVWSVPSIFLPYSANLCDRQHRKLIVLAMNDSSRELGFCSRALQIDAKNYHTWAYRHWALCHFYPPSNPSSKPVWDSEITYSESLINEDLRNNSAWNYRYFVIFENGVYENEMQNKVKEEIEFTQDQLKLAPNNASAWNYLRGCVYHILSVS